MTLAQRVSVLEQKVATLEAENLTQKQQIFQLLITANMVQPNRDMINELRTRLWPFFVNGADRNQEFDTWLESQVPHTP